jgi:hypothetical protein
VAGSKGRLLPGVRRPFHTHVVGPLPVQDPGAPHRRIVSWIVVPAGAPFDASRVIQAPLLATGIPGKSPLNRLGKFWKSRIS